MDDILRAENLLKRKAGPFQRSFSSLYFRNFRLLWLGNILIGTGHGADNVAVGWLMLGLTGSPFLVGAAAFCRMFPLLVLPAFAGVLVDRLDRRKFLITADALVTVTSLVVFAFVLSGLITAWQLLLGALIAGTAFAMISTARQALMPSLVSPGRLQNAVAVYSFSNNTAGIFAPSLAGTLISFAGIASSFLLGAVGYAGALCTAVLLRAPAMPENSKAETVWQNMQTGFGYIRKQKSVLAVLILSGATALFGMSYTSMLPVLALQVFAVDASGLGFMMGFNGVGALSGSALLALWGNIPRRGLLAIGSLVVFSLAVVALSLSNSIYVAYVVLSIAGLSLAFVRALAMVLVMNQVPDSLRGRVLSIYVMSFGLQTLGSLAIGAIAQATNTPLAVGLTGAVTGLSALAIAVFVPELRRLK